VIDEFLRVRYGGPGGAYINALQLRAMTSAVVDPEAAERADRAALKAWKKLPPKARAKYARPKVRRAYR